MIRIIWSGKRTYNKLIRLRSYGINLRFCMTMNFGSLTILTISNIIFSIVINVGSKISLLYNFGSSFASRMR